MAIEISIRQPWHSRKTMPIDIILGNELHPGCTVGDRFESDCIGTVEFIAYEPECIGRGFSVKWNERETQQIDLRLPVPSTTREIKVMFAAAQRMARYWNAKITVDGTPRDLFTLNFALDDTVAFNERTLHHMCARILDGTDDSLVTYSLIPLTVGKAEAEQFQSGGDNAFTAWLHQMQKHIL